MNLKSDHYLEILIACYYPSTLDYIFSLFCIIFLLLRATYFLYYSVIFISLFFYTFFQADLFISNNSILSLSPFIKTLHFLHLVGSDLLHQERLISLSFPYHYSQFCQSPSLYFSRIRILLTLEAN